MKNILILGPLWRNKKIFNELKKNHKILVTNKKINKKYIIQKKIDILITSGYAFLVKKDILNLVKIKINLHMSYLPYGRGIMPNLWSFYERFPPGVTIHELDNNFDTGKILVQKKIYFKKLKIKTLKTTHDYLLIQLEKFFFQITEKFLIIRSKDISKTSLLKLIDITQELRVKN